MKQGRYRGVAGDATTNEAWVGAISAISLISCKASIQLPIFWYISLLFRLSRLLLSVSNIFLSDALATDELKTLHFRLGQVYEHENSVMIAWLNGRISIWLP